MTDDYHCPHCGSDFPTRFQLVTHDCPGEQPKLTGFGVDMGAPEGGYTAYYCGRCHYLTTDLAKMQAHKCADYLPWLETLQARIAADAESGPAPIAELQEAAAMRLPPLDDGGALHLKLMLARLTGADIGS